MRWRHSPRRNLPNKSSRSNSASTHDQRNLEPLAHLPYCFRYWPMISTRRRDSVSRRLTTSSLAGFSLAIDTCAPLRTRIPSAGSGKPPHLGAVGLGDPAARFQLSPWHVILLGPDQGEHVSLAAVFAHQGGSQAQATPGLDLGRHPKNGSGQQMHLVINDQAPVLLIEKLEVRELFLLVGAMRQDLIGGQCDGPISLLSPVYFFTCSSRSVLSRISRCHCLTAVILVVSTRVCAAERHGRNADYRLASSAGSTMTPLPPRTSPPA